MFEKKCQKAYCLILLQHSQTTHKYASFIQRKLGYKERLFQLTGSIMVAAILEVFIGATGLVSVLLRFIGPLTVAPTIMLMGLSVAADGFDLAGKHWGISLG